MMTTMAPEAKTVMRMIRDRNKILTVDGQGSAGLSGRY